MGRPRASEQRVRRMQDKLGCASAAAGGHYERYLLGNLVRGYIPVRSFKNQERGPIVKEGRFERSGDLDLLIWREDHNIPKRRLGTHASRLSLVSKPIKRTSVSREIPAWVSEGEFTDITYQVAEGMAKITINRPEVHNAFRPQTLFELAEAFNMARDDDSVGVIIFTGAGDEAFCSGGDIRIRGNDGYLGEDKLSKKGVGRLNVLDLQIQIRRTPKPVVAMVAGWVIGGGHVLHVVCDLTIAADNAKFGQTGPMVGSFDGGYGSGLLARHVGQKKAREIWFLCRQYDAQEALDMGLINTVVPLAELEAETVQWSREMLQHSPMALRLLKASMNAADDGLAGVQQLAGDATLLFYLTEEGQEGRDAYKEKREPRFDRFPRRP